MKKIIVLIFIAVVLIIFALPLKDMGRQYSQPVPCRILFLQIEDIKRMLAPDLSFPEGTVVDSNEVHRIAWANHWLPTNAVFKCSKGGVLNYGKTGESPACSVCSP